jgi:hypothetical protein
VAGVVDHDVETARLLDDPRDAGVDGVLRGDVELYGAQVYAVLIGVPLGLGDPARVAAGRLADTSVDGVAGVGEGAGAERPEPGTGPANDDDFAHDADLYFLCPFSLLTWRGWSSR